MAQGLDIYSSMISKSVRLFIRKLPLVTIVVLSGALAPRMTDDELLGRSAFTSRALSSSGVAYASDEVSAETFNTSYDPIHELQSGLRDSDEIAHEILKIAGDSIPFKWNSDFWLKNGVSNGTFALTTILSHYQNLENRFEVMFIHSLPSENRNESQITLFTDRINEADEKTIGASILLPHSLELRDGRAIYDENQAALYLFRLSSSGIQRNFGLRDPEGAYEFAKRGDSKLIIDPISNLNQADGPFDEVGNYQYDQKLGEHNYEVFINPRWRPEAHQLTIEVQSHESDSLVMKTFVLVYEFKAKK